MEMNHHVDSTVGGSCGFVFSFLMSVSFSDFAQQGLMAFIFGIIGAIGGIIATRVWKKIEKHWSNQDKKKL